MINKKLTLFSINLLTISFCSILGAAMYESKNATNSKTIYPNGRTEREDAKRKDEIMEEDEIDSTDTYAIPLDSSEIEDEEEINRLERKKVFNLQR